MSSLGDILRRSALDDRGREYTPVVLAEIPLHAKGAAHRDAARDLQRVLRSMVQQETRRFSPERLVVGLILCAAFVTLTMLAQFLLGQARGAVLPAIVPILAITALALADAAYTRRRLAGAIGSTITAHGFCGSCGYSLEGLGPSEDGRIVCPECSHAWRPGRITRPHWAPPRAPLAPRRGLRAAFLLLRPPLVRDSRAMLCRRIDSWLLSIPPQRGRELGPIAADLRRAIRRPTLWLRASIAGALVLPLLWLFAHFPAGDDAAADAVLLATRLAWWAGLLIVLCMIAVTLAGELGVTTPRVVAACVERSLCASCAAPLPPPDAEGYRVCPNCGASWRIVQT